MLYWSGTHARSHCLALSKATDNLGLLPSMVITFSQHTLATQASGMAGRLLQVLALVVVMMIHQPKCFVVTGSLHLPLA